MSAKAATVSKGRAHLEKTVAELPRAIRERAGAGGAKPPEAAPQPEPTSPAPPAIAASAIELVPFRQLKRAPENVRHIRKDEDIEGLADSIAAEGLLQSLIGYRAPDEEHRTPVDRVWIVGGGRRLQALGILLDRFAIDLDFVVPVLIRDRAEAIELSLTENLQKRDMSPVDECRAFVALMAPGTTSPAELAKRFGFSEVYVKQRLRLAELAGPILDALAEKKITIASAMAYAASSDRELQLQVFHQQEKTSWEKHAIHRVRADYAAAQLTTSSGLFRFVGAAAYEAEGGDYEDDLFAEAATAGSGRKLAHGPLLKAIAARMIDARADEVLADKRFLSMEPLLGPVDLTRLCQGVGDGVGPWAGRKVRLNVDGLRGAQSIGWPPLDWIIVGGESGPGARPMHPEWVISLRDQCEGAGVPFLFKQWGEHLPVYVVTASRTGVEYRRVGKKAAGRRLQGVTHDAVPA